MKLFRKIKRKYKKLKGGYFTQLDQVNLMLIEQLRKQVEII